MDGVTSFPSTHGKYRIDHNIPVTGACKLDIPIYRQVGGNGYLWYDGYDWYHTTVVCYKNRETRQFLTFYSTTANSPDLYTGGGAGIWLTAIILIMSSRPASLSHRVVSAVIGLKTDFRPNEVFV